MKQEMTFEDLANGLMCDHPAGTLVMRNRIVDLLKMVAHVPGNYRCPQCPFTLTKSVLDAETGAVAVSLDAPEPCPNDGSEMVPITWEQYARQLEELVTAFQKMPTAEV